LAKYKHVGNGLPAFLWLQYFWQSITDLWSEDAEPNPPDLLSGAPELHEFLQIAGPLHHLTGDGAVDRDLLASDILQNPIVRGRSTSQVVLPLQTIDGYDDVQAGECYPRWRQLAERAGYNLEMKSTIKEQRNHDLELLIPNQRVATNNRKMQGLEAVNRLDNAIDQLLAFAIAETSQSHPAP
jgi:hypothetical protein